MPDIPAPPDDMSPDLLAAWNAFWTSSLAQRTHGVDLPAIRRLYDLYARHQKATEVVRQALVVKGSVGQIRVNPLADHLLKLEPAILRLESELGLTPLARSRIGVALEPAHALKASVIDELAKRRTAG